MQPRRYQIEWMLLGTVLLGLGALMGYWLNTERDEVTSRERDRLQTQARVIDENLGRQLEGANNALAGVRDEFPLPVNKSLAQAASRHLKALRDAMPGVRTMLLVNAEGLVLAASRDEVIGLNASKREYFTVPRERPDPSMLYISAPFRTTLGVFSINMVHVVTGSRGEFAGIVSATLDPEYFNVALRSVLYAPDMWTSIAHGDGTGFLFMPPIEKATGMDLTMPGTFFFRHRESGQTASIMTGTIYATGEERMMAVRTIRLANVPVDKPLVVGVSRDLSAIYARWRNDVLVDSGLYAVIALTTILGLTFSQRRQRKFDRLEADHEIERRESAERLELAVAGADLGLWDWHVPSDKAVFNARWCAMLGYPVDELVPNASAWRERVHPDDWPVIHAALDLHLQGETPAYESEHRMRHKDGHWIWVLGRGKVMERDATGAPVRMVGTQMDITERKHIEEALRESEDRYRDLVEHSQDLICTHDLDGRILSANPRPAEILGYARDELLKMNIRDLLATEMREDFPRYIEELRRTGISKGLMRLHTRAGERRIWDYVNTLRTEGVSTPVVRGMAHDVTERMRAEKALRERESLLRSVFATLPVGVTVTDDKGMILSVNPAGQRIWAGAKYVGIEHYDEYKGWWATTGKRIEAKEWALARAVTKGEISSDEEIEIECINGTRRRILNSAAPIRDSRQRITGAIGVSQDVTEHRLAEEGMRALARFPSESPNPVLRVSRDGVLLYANESSRSLLTEWACAVGQPVPPLWRTLVAEALGTNSRKTVNAEFEHQAYSVVVAPVAEGKYVNLYGRDITERRQAENALREGERRYRNLSDNMLAGFAYCKMLFENGRPVDYVYVGVNPAFERLTGLKNVAWKKVTELIPGIRESNPELFERYGRVASTGKSEAFEIYMASMDIWLSVSAFCPKKGYFIAISENITERKRAELALARRTHLYDMLSQTNKAIVRIAGRDELFDAVCRIAVEHGHFHFVWIGVIDTVHQRLKAIAHYGKDAGYLDKLDLSGDSPAASRHAGGALLSGSDVVINDFLNDPATAPWYEAARHAGIRAVAKFPIRQGGAVVGAISFYADEPKFFSEDLIATLDAMAEDVSFALDKFAHQAEISYAAEALRASEAKFRLLAEENLAGVMIIQDGRFKYVNPAMARMFGYSPEDLLRASSVSVLEFVAEENRALIEKNLRRRQDGEALSMRYTFRGKKKDGSPSYFEVFGSRIPFEGRFAVMSTVLDITERKRAEETQATLAAIVESSNDAIIGRALDGTVTSWNAAAERILGYTAAETIGRDLVEIFPPRLRQQVAENLKLVWAGQMVPSHEAVRITKDGRDIDVAVSLSAIKDDSGRIIGTATTLHDITARKQAEQALHDNATRLRTLSRRLFTAAETERRNINRELHDRVGQNLAALNINLNIIRSQLPQQSLDAVGARIRDTQTLLEETAAQVRNVMADLHPPALDDYGLHAALRAYIQDLGTRITVPISMHGEPFVPRLPLTVETALFRVAQGALVNAVTHAQAKHIQVLLAATPDQVTLTIADDGVGFDVTHASLAHASWGLAIMRERAEAVGAELTVESTPGKGTRVCVAIPREMR